MKKVVQSLSMVLILVCCVGLTGCFINIGDITPAAPKNVTAERDILDGSVKIKWDTVHGASSYTVYWCSSEYGTYIPIKKSIIRRDYTDESASNSDNYYKVTAVSSSGTEGPASDSVKARLFGIF
jgi:fibronectin type 3 domain-containing protein